MGNNPTVAELIRKLDQVHVQRTSAYLHDNEAMDESRLAELEGLATEAFVTDDGMCNHTAMRELKETSQGRYYVRPGEVDSFGWLTGLVCTPMGILVYG